MRPRVEESALGAARCEFCGLSVVASRPGKRSLERARYCCYGCYVADSIVRGADRRSDAGKAARWLLARILIASFLAMGVMVFSIVLWSSAVFSPAEGETHPLGPLAGLFRWFALVLSTPALILLGLPILRGSLPLVFRGRRGDGERRLPSAVDALVTLGAGAAWCLSVIHVARGEGEVYFETAVLLLLLLTVGRWLEATARVRARRSLGDLAALLPDRAILVTAGGREESVAVSALARGHIVRIRPGERIPIDGKVAEGIASVDVSLVTGESEPRSCGPGDAVFGGTSPVDGTLDIIVSSRKGERLVDRLHAAVDEALRSRPRIERIAEISSRHFLRAVVAIALGTFAFWGARLGWFEGLRASLAVLLIACPCSLGIAAPLAIAVAVDRAARRGILVRNGDVFEALAGRGACFFDKTGTLTLPELELSRIVPVDDADPVEVFATAISLAAWSTHPVASAIRRAAEEQGRNQAASSETGDPEIALARSTRPETRPGRGVRREDRGGPSLLGSDRLLEEEGIAVPHDERLLDGRRTGEKRPVWVVREGRVLGAITLRESLRPEAHATVLAVKSAGFDVEVLTGDERVAADDLARVLSVPVHANLLPNDKVDRVRERAARGGAVIMVGDGLNDAPVIAAATVGISLASATDLARDSADVVLVDSGRSCVLDGLPLLLDLSRRTLARIRWNLVWAFGYNTIGIVLAATGHVHPVLAALLMMVSSLCVVATSVGPNWVVEGERRERSPLAPRVFVGETLGAGSLERNRT